MQNTNCTYRLTTIACQLTNGSGKRFTRQNSSFFSSIFFWSIVRLTSAHTFLRSSLP
ncbi:MAG: hypothetical protein QM764_23915 [Chitinophagaceae bacterium]